MILPPSYWALGLHYVPIAMGAEESAEHPILQSPTNDQIRQEMWPDLQISSIPTQDMSGVHLLQQTRVVTRPWLGMRHTSKKPETTFRNLNSFCTITVLHSVGCGL